MRRLTGIILTYNEAAHIQACIESLRFTDHILVFDSFSEDNTIVLAQEAGVEVRQHHFENFASQRNAALEAVARETEWVLFVDADERVTAELALEVSVAIESLGYAGWRIPRYNYIFGKLTCGAGWYPDYQTRLLRVGAAHYDPERQVHEVIRLSGPLGTFVHHLVHCNYRDVVQFHAKQQRYSAYDAQVLYQQSIRPKAQNYVLQPLRHFWWRFVTLRGYRDGLHGLHLSLLMARYELYKYLLLRTLWRR